MGPWGELALMGGLYRWLQGKGGCRQRMGMCLAQLSPSVCSEWRGSMVSGGRGEGVAGAPAPGMAGL